MSIVKLASGAALVTLSVYAQNTFFKNEPRFSLLKTGVLAGSIYFFIKDTADKILGINSTFCESLTRFEWRKRQLTMIVLSAPLFIAGSLLCKFNHSLKGATKSFAVGYSLILGLDLAFSRF